MSTATMSTKDVIAEYYAAWRNGIERFDRARLRSVLADDMEFDGPIAGKVSDPQRFIAGVERFSQSINGLHIVQEVYMESEAAVLYDCEMKTSVKTMRFAEFFEVKDGKVASLRLLFDKADLMKD